MSPKQTIRFAVAAPAVIFLSCYLLSLTAVFKSHEAAASSAMLGDLLITAPLVYFFIIRKTNISKLSVIRVFIIGLLVAGFIVSNDQQAALHFIKTWVSPFAELIVIFFIVKKFSAAAKKAKLSNDRADFLLICRSVMRNITGNEKAGNIIASEIAVFYYAFFSRSVAVNDQTIFSSYKKNGILTVLYAILFLFMIEAAGMHFLFAMLNNTVAWVLTALSLYTCMQLFAHIRAVKARPVFINDRELRIRNGLAGDATIDFSNISSIEISKKIPSGNAVQKIALLKGLEGHNIIVELKEPIAVTKIFGIKKTANTVLFYVDQPQLLITAIEKRINSAAL